MKKNTYEIKVGLAEMLKGGVIMDVTNLTQAKIAEDSGACAVMALERIPADIRKDGGIARMSDPLLVKEIQKTVSIPVMAKCRIGHFAEANILEALEVDFIDESEVLTPADEEFHIDKNAYKVPFVCGARNLGESLRRIGEGAAMIRTKGEAGSGNIVEAVKHMRAITDEIQMAINMNSKEDPITQESRIQTYDPNIQIPAYVIAYRTPGFRERDAYVLDMISTYLSDGQSSKLYKKMVDDQKQAVQVGAFNVGQEDYGMYLVYALPVGETTGETLIAEMEEEIAKVRTELITERDHQKLLNKFENSFVNSNSSVAGIANSLARNYLLYGDTDLINKEIEIYRSITREEIQEVADKYFKPNQRVIIDYLPKEAQAN